MEANADDGKGGGTFLGASSGLASTLAFAMVDHRTAASPLLSRTLVRNFSQRAAEACVTLEGGADSEIGFPHRSRGGLDAADGCGFVCFARAIPLNMS